MSIEILGTSFSDSATMKEVLFEFKRQGIDLSTIPYHFHKEKEIARRLFDLKNLSAQELLDMVDKEESYLDLTKQ
jgi:hypothetical protein